MGMSSRVVQSLREMCARNVDIEAAEGTRVGEGGSVEATGIAAVCTGGVRGVGKEGEVVERVGRVFDC